MQTMFMSVICREFNRSTHHFFSRAKAGAQETIPDPGYFRTLNKMQRRVETDKKIASETRSSESGMGVFCRSSKISGQPLWRKAV